MLVVVVQAIGPFSQAMRRQSEVEQLGRELAPMWDVGIKGSSLI